MRAYVDSNVLISALREEIGKGFRLLFVEADRFLKYAAENELKLVLSDFCLFEVEKKISLKEKDVREYLEALDVTYEIVKTKGSDKQEIRNIEKLGIHYSDAMHAVIALRERCDYIVTFNKKDFESASRLVKIETPNELISSPSF